MDDNAAQVYWQTSTRVSDWCKMPPGGDELNVAVALSLLGVKSKWVSDSVADSSIFLFCFFESEVEACQNCIVRCCVTQQQWFGP